MTKEEISKVLELALEYYKLEIFGTGKESQPPTQERIDYIYDHMQSSIPSNLDEAVEEYANTHYGEFAEVEYEFGSPNETIVDDKPFVRDAFKAGAKWMAGQGETQEHFVIGSIADSPCGPAIVCYTEEFVIGDEVIVQIRKKQ